MWRLGSGGPHFQLERAFECGPLDRVECASLVGSDHAVGPGQGLLVGFVLPLMI